MWESGIISRNKKIYLRQWPKKVLPSDPVKFRDVAEIFIFLMLFMLLSIAVLVFEINEYENRKYLV